MGEYTEVLIDIHKDPATLQGTALQNNSYMLITANECDGPKLPVTGIEPPG